MSATPARPVSGSPKLRVQFAAIVVVLALAALAAYTLFSGPTTVSVKGPAGVAPTQTVPSEGGAEPEGRGDRGD